jgi:hypothetical protein
VNLTGAVLESPSFLPPLAPAAQPNASHHHPSSIHTFINQFTTLLHDLYHDASSASSTPPLDESCNSSPPLDDAPAILCNPQIL